MADFNKPATTDTYANLLAYLNAKIQDLALGLDPANTLATNVPTNAVRWNSANNRFEKYNGTAWGVLSSTYAFTNITGTGSLSLNSGALLFDGAHLTVTNGNIISDGTAGIIAKNGNSITFYNSGNTAYGVMGFTSATGIYANSAFSVYAGNNLYLWNSINTSKATIYFSGSNVMSDQPFSIQGITLGRGAGAVATNTAVGASALSANTTAAYQTAQGYQAGYNVTGGNNTAIGGLAMRAVSGSTGTDNTALGYGVLYGLTTGSYNVAIGGQDNGTNTTLNNTTTGSYNVAIGNAALKSNTTGGYNVSIGYQSLFSSQTASNNTAVGFQAGFNSTGDRLTAVGLYAGKGNTTGNYNTFLGSYTGYGNSGALTGNSNTGIGNASLYNLTSGTYNNGFGYGALFAVTTGSYNNAFGGNALANTTGSNNTAFGESALQANSSASNNTALGYQAGYSTTTSGRNVYVGMYAGYSANRADGDAGNTYVGYQSGYSTTTGYANTFLGGNGSNQLGAAGQSLTTGVFNTFLGAAAGYYVTTGSKNTILGAYSGNQGGLDIRTANNFIVLSDGDGNPRLISDASGNWMAGTTSSPVSGCRFRAAAGTGDWSFGPNTGGNAYFVINASSVGAYLSSGATAWAAYSDERLKTDLVAIDDAASKVMSIRARIGRYKTDAEGTRRSFLIAQDVQKVLPEAVNVQKDEIGTLGLQYTDVIPLLVAAIQEMNTRMAAIETTIH